MPSRKLHILLMGQTPPPWHGQAVATQILFEHDWPEFEVHRLRMEFSEEMLEVGRFQWKKIRHLLQLIRKARAILRENPGCVLFYPPASAKWIPFLRDVVFLTSVRGVAGGTVFIFHASGLPVFVKAGPIRRLMGRAAYHRADVALEVAQEVVTPHEVFAAKSWQWCPCAIAVPDLERRRAPEPGRITALFVGSLQEGKGVSEIFKTASILKKQGREQDFKFRIVGKWFSQDFENDIRHMRAELQLEDMVELVGQLTGDDKWQAYAQADVFFFPTHYAAEATPIVLMEALGMGLPVLSTQWAGIPAMLEGCETAWLLPIRSPEQYAKALEDLHTRRHESSEMQHASRAFYQEKFLPERFIERVGNAFLAAAGEPEAEETITANTARDGAVLDRNAVTCPEGVSEPCGASESNRAGSARPSSDLRPSTFRPLDSTSSVNLTVYLADQNPGYDRSFGISRMSQVVLKALQKTGKARVRAISSQTSQQTPNAAITDYHLPWGTRNKLVRLLTDHFHPLLCSHAAEPNIYYYPKGYLPLVSGLCRPSVVTIHDTIIQYDEDHYPTWRKPSEYRYWAMMLKHTLRQADRILTVSESSKRQIHDFMERHGIPKNGITVTYEPCLYEGVPQPVESLKENYVIHLASCEPHKRTAHLIRWWHEEESKGRNLPMLHLIGSVPPEVQSLLASSHSIVKSPFLEEAALQAAYRSARALILPSEVEGFGLPALEAYYLGTPVCFVRGTSVEEILGVVTSQGGFSLDSSESLFTALDEVMAMSQDQVRACGLKLRETYAAEKVAARMMAVFAQVKK
jgi:glycosyltransferase involved in cell wall biosynthesis